MRSSRLALALQPRFDALHLCARRLRSRAMCEPANVVARHASSQSPHSPECRARLSQSECLRGPDAKRWALPQCGGLLCGPRLVSGANARASWRATARRAIRQYLRANARRQSGFACRGALTNRLTSHRLARTQQTGPMPGSAPCTATTAFHFLRPTAVGGANVRQLAVALPARGTRRERAHGLRQRTIRNDARWPAKGKASSAEGPRTSQNSTA